MVKGTISTVKVESYLSKFLKTPAQNSKALEDLWLDPVHWIRTSFLRWQKWNSSVETAVKEWLRVCAFHSSQTVVYFILVDDWNCWSCITIQQLERFPKLFRISSWDTLHIYNMVFTLQSWDTTLLCGFLYLSLRFGVSLDLYLKLL